MSDPPEHLPPHPATLGPPAEHLPPNPANFGRPAEHLPPNPANFGRPPGPRVQPVDLRDYVSFDQTAARRVRVLATDVLTIDLWCLEPWQDTEVLHYEDVDVVYTVIGGNGWFMADHGDVGLGPLGAMLIPATVAHGISNRTADPLVVLASGSPPDGPGGVVETSEPVERTDGAVHRLGGRRSLADRVRGFIGA